MRDWRDKEFRFAGIVRFLRRKAAGLVLRLALALLSLTGPKVFVKLFKLLTYAPIIRMPAVRLCRRSLYRAGWKNMAADWMGEVCERFPQRLDFRIHHVHALLDARRFDEAHAALMTAKAMLGMRPKNFRYVEQISDYEAALSINRRSISTASVVFAVGRSPTIADFCYQRAWDAHAVLDSVQVGVNLSYYFQVIGYEPAAVIYACDTLMTPNALWRDIVAALKQVKLRHLDDQVDGDESGRGRAGGRLQDLMQALHFMQGRDASRRRLREEISLRIAHAQLQLGDFVAAADLLAQGGKPTTAWARRISGLLELYRKDGGDTQAGRELLLLAYADVRNSNANRAEIAGEIGVSYEEAGEFEAARHFYASSYVLGGVPFFLPEYLWRYVCFCMAQGDYPEASVIMRAALRVIWQGFHALARMPIEKRLQKGNLVPQADTFFLGCWGIGDDIIRMAMFDALHGPTEGKRFGLSVDPRMQHVYERAFNGFEIVPISRMSGPFAVPEAEYLRLREGIPAALDRGRLDQNVIKAARGHKSVSLTEDLLIGFIEAGPELRRQDRPLLSTLPAKEQAALAWLGSLPPGVKVGISWRSGTRDVMRNKSYTDIVDDWGAILTQPNMTFINLQYSWDAEELAEAQARHDCVIHTPPFDLKNDIEDIIALAKVLDVVLSPGTAVREMCAAAGANVWSLATTLFFPDIWRLEPGSQRDRLFPSMTHITAYDHKDAHGVLQEVGRRLGALAQSRGAVAE